MATAGTIGSSTIHEVLIFSGDKETKEYEGRKHIGAEDLLREMARRRAANPAWNNKADIGQCVRSFRNDVPGWWEEAVPSDHQNQAVGGVMAIRGEGSHTCKEMTKQGEQIFFRLGTLNVNSLKVARKRRNILRQLR
jgi:hypothetical protein